MYLQIIIQLYSTIFVYLNMVSYKERKAKAKYYVLIKDTEVIGLYGSLKNLCDTYKEIDSSFPSYWTLTRKKENRLDFREYSIQTINLT